ncbi:GNAT family N-acetyltransferase [Parvularcula sp. ZS-1/3]|uniref:GNAT family N-acetyltransferase n=1 Tax=Parvularcula mediterranea TaxID=2732508 RepID=A0A7Y3RJL3_9PROT|nr:GNAT family protein [Parvularcula mediterranea]NNU15274.1 GNAT family N-acetyltransferase [Parvularcula mediterranea]
MSETWSPRRTGCPGHDVLDGSSVTLTPVAQDGVSEALARAMLRESAELWRWMGIGPFADEETFLAMLAEQAEAGLNLMAISKPGGPPLGMAAFMRMKPQFGCAEIGSVTYGQDLQRTKAGTEAIFLMLKHIFEDYGWRRAEWICNDQNKPSARAGERYGFTYEGTFRNHRWVKGANRDTAWFSMIDTEWPERKATFEAWLDDANFFADGKQLKSLTDLRHR